VLAGIGGVGFSLVIYYTSLRSGSSESSLVGTQGTGDNMATGQQRFDPYGLPPPPNGHPFLNSPLGKSYK
jgi:hypothetical protein